MSFVLPYLQSIIEQKSDQERNNINPQQVKLLHSENSDKKQNVF